MKAPDFTLQDQNGTTHSLSEYAGKWLVLYFYLKDETSGCTTQACSFRDARELLASLGNVEVVGISIDSVQSHKEFADKHELTFTLLSDPDHTTAEAYGAWKPDPTKGSDYIPTQRNTYIISPDGDIVKTYENVDPNTNTAVILSDLQELQAAA